MSNAEKWLPPPGNFRLMVAGQIVSIPGSALLRFALSLHVLDITQSETAFAALLNLVIIPCIIVAAPPGQFLYGAAFEGFSGAEYLPLLMAGGIKDQAVCFQKWRLTSGLNFRRLISRAGNGVF